MFRSKKDVDRHVREIFRKLTNEDEKTLRSYNIAKLYYQVGDYESAKRYVSGYLKLRTGSAGAYKLLGQALEALGQKKEALAQYKISLELDAKQDSLVLKICEILADMDLKNDSIENDSTIKYWIDRADVQFPHHPTIFKLKEKMLTMEKSIENNEDLEELIKSELTARPMNVDLHVKLLKFYLTNNKLDIAFSHIVNTEVHQIYRNSLVWYQILSEVLGKYKDRKVHDWSFWMFYLSVLERHTALTVKEQENKTHQAMVDTLFNFDQCLNHAKRKNFSENSAFTSKVFMHMWGQLHFHLACLYLWRTKREEGNWSEARRICAPLFLCALNTSPIDPNVLVAIQVKDSVLKDLLKSQIRMWHREGAYRCSQAGHILQDYVKGDLTKFMAKVEKFCIGSWRERVYKRIFENVSYQNYIEYSYFVKHLSDYGSSPNPFLRLCTKNELKQYDEIAELVYPDSLHHHVWIGMNNKPFNQNKDSGPFPYYYSHVFPKLQVTASNLNQAAPESLSQLDIDAFLNATILCSFSTRQDRQLSQFLNPERYQTLPADLMSSLCTTAQEKWWSCAYKMYSKQEIGNGAFEERQELQRGLEVVRCIGSHGLHPVILVHLARIFYHKVKLLKEKDEQHSHISALETRCELYWSNAITLLERLQNNQAIHISISKLFNYQGRDMNNVEMTSAFEEGQLFLAQRFLKDKQYEQAIVALQALKCPEASFQQGLIYKTLALEAVDSTPKDSLTSEMRSQNVIMLSKARNCFYLTLDRLRSPGMNPKHPLNSELCIHISEVENELRRVDPDLGRSELNKNECDGMSDESYSSAHSGIELPIINTSYVGFSPMSNVSNIPQISYYRTPKQSSTPSRAVNQDLMDISKNRLEARPSPERLDAQMRQMMHTKNNIMQTILEQNKSLMETNKVILERIEVLTKDFAELKKETQKQRIQPININTVIDNDIPIGLEEDYSDLSYGSNAAGAQPTIPGNLFVPSHRNPYQQLVYPSPTAFQGYYQGAIPFNDPSAPALSTLYPQVYPPMPTMYSNKTKLPDNVLQQGIFRGRSVMPHLSDLVASSPVGLANPMQAVPGLVQTPTQTSIQTPIQTPVQTPIQTPLQTPVQGVDTPKYESKIKNAPLVKTPPMNVVITASDVLPTTVPAQSILSVTIPPQHRASDYSLQSTAAKASPVLSTITVSPPISSATGEANAPHNYQISMPSQATIPTTVNLPSLAVSLTTTSVKLSSPQTFQVNTTSVISTSHNTTMDELEQEHDPIPDFVPVIPLPAEVEVTTGEEDETTLFCGRAKLFRFVNKEWKERGIGKVKLLKNKEGKVRLLMRRDQVLKICANHMLRPDMELTPMPNNDKAWIWAANDFADEEVRLEKLCIRFKSSEEAQAFKECFDKAKNGVPCSPEEPVEATATSDLVKSEEESTKQTVEETRVAATAVAAAAAAAAAPPLVLGGFSFISEPIIPKEPTKATVVGTKGAQNPEELAKPSPFMNFSFNKQPDKPQETTTTQSNNFNLVNKPSLNTVPVSSANAAKLSSPVVVEKSDKKQETGSTDATPTTVPFATLRRPHAPSPAALVSSSQIDLISDGTLLLEENGTLFSTEKNAVKLKDEGAVTLKIIQNQNTRKLYVHLQGTSKTKTYEATSNQTLQSKVENNSIHWTAKDPNKGDELFTVSFATNQQALRVYSCLLNNQQKSDKSKSLMDKFKPAPGSWDCQACYCRNTAAAVACVACQTPNPTAPKPQTQQPSLSQLFKPAPGSWECKDCYCRNDASKSKCCSCNAPSPVAAQLGQSTKPTSLAEIPKVSSTPESWECKSCHISNSATNVYCVTCDSPKDPSMPPKPKTNSFSFTGSSSAAAPTGGFSFGIPPEAAKDVKSGFSFSLSASGTDSVKSTPIFGTPKSNESGAKTVSNFLQQQQQPQPQLQQSTPPNSPSPQTFKFGSPGKSFDFQFNTKADVRSPGGAEQSEEEEVPESDDIYFAPAIPLPNKIEVKTGEEDEEILYSHRAKLFRYDATTKEWKERGLGDIKLLRHKENGKLRLIMRRDQILKLCLNHMVQPSLKLTAKDEKTWFWNAADYSDGEIEYIQFACRFKTPDIAEEFKRAIEKAIKDEGESSVTESKSLEGDQATEKAKSPQRDIDVVYELQVTPEEKAAALKLQLPQNFYAYKQKEDCPGCIGCKEPGITLFEDPAKPVKSDASQDAKITSSGAKASSIFSNPSSTTTFSFGNKVTFGATSTTAATTGTPVFEFGLASKTNSNVFEKSSTFGDKGFLFGQQNNNTSAAVPGGGAAAAASTPDKLLDNLKICSPSNKTQPTEVQNKSLSSPEQQQSIFGGQSNKVSPNSRFTLRNPKLVLNPTTAETTVSSTTDEQLATTFTNMFSGLPRTSTTTSTGQISSSVLPPIFGTPSGKSIFGGTATHQNSTATTTAPVFGSSVFTSTPSTTPVFSSTTSAPTFGSTIFGTTATPTFGSTVFGTAAATTATPTFGTTVFGAAATTAATPTFGSTVFGTAATTTANPVFGSTIFGGTAATAPASKFGPKVFGTSPVTATCATIVTDAVDTKPSTFGSTVFGTEVLKTSAAPNFSFTTAPPGSTFSPTGFSVGPKAPESTRITATPVRTKPNLSTSDSKPNDKATGGNVANSNVFNARLKLDESKGEEKSILSSNLSFSALKTQSDQEAFKIGMRDPNFSFAGAGSSVFGKQSTPNRQSEPKEQKKKDDDEEAYDENENENDQEYDPYYEPIIPLPKAIEVRTGEEDEEIVYSERARLYRFAAETKEWKERGVGEMKLLHHREHGTYRLLLRREQVHKVVCNFLVTADIEFKPLHTSDRVWIWAGMNYAEETPALEELALRLKTPENAQKFKDVIDRVQEELRSRQLTQDQNPGNLGDDEDETNSVEDEDEDDDDDEDDDQTLLFQKRATLYAKTDSNASWKIIALGNLSIYYDSEIFGHRIILVSDEDIVLSNTIVSMETVMEVSGQECIWSAKDYALEPPIKRYLRALFSSPQAADEMYRLYEEGLDCAKKADISDPEIYN